VGRALLFAVLLAACPSRTRAPRAAPAADVTLPIEGAIRGVAASGTLLFAATSSDVQAYRTGAVAWRTPLAGAGPIAASTKLVAVTTSLSSEAGTSGVAAGSTGAAARSTGAAPAVRGDPAAAVVALDATTGAIKWTLLFDSTEWAIATSIAMLENDLIVAGSFGGTLRAGKRVVTSAGSSDGFVARISATGELAWLIRLGGAGSDGVQGVATRAGNEARRADTPARAMASQTIAIAGTFTAGAELAGVPLPAYDDRVPSGDVFVAQLDGNGARQWAATIGGRGDDAVAGVAIDERANLVVAASAKEVIHVGSAQLVTQGESDGVLAWFGPSGEKGAAVLVGGMDFDGLRAITAVGDRIVVGGFFSGSLKLGDRTLTAGGGDDAFVAAFDVNGTLATAWHVGGEGREEVTALASVPGGFVAGVAHTAKALIETAPLAAPKDPVRGGAVIVRGVP
jgi:hypothetical protein